jgi:hypothetical protein
LGFLKHFFSSKDILSLKPKVIFMRQIKCLLTTSYPFILIVLINCFFGQQCIGQPVVGTAAGGHEFIYGWCSYVRDSRGQAVDMPLLTVNQASIHAPTSTGGEQDGLIILKNGDSIMVASSEIDSLGSGEAAASNLSLPGAGDVNELASTGALQPNKGASAILSSVFDEETDILINKYAAIISVAPDEVNNFHLYKFIDQWYGVRYKWGGNDNNGIDCSGFSQKLYGSIYSLAIMRTARQQHKKCEIIKDYEDATEGDLVFFRIRHLGISHVGIYLANGFFVHASRSRGVVISNLEDKYWRRRYAGCGKVEKEDLSGKESEFLQ